MAKGINIVVHGREMPYDAYVQNGMPETATEKSTKPRQRLFSHERLEKSVPLVCASGVIRFERVKPHLNGFELQKDLAGRAQPVFGAARGLLLYRHQRRIDHKWQHVTILFPLDTFSGENKRYWFGLKFDESISRWAAHAVDLSWELSTPTVIATI